METVDDGDLLALLSATLEGHSAGAAVICLCAAWCNTCTEYRAVFDQAELAHPHLIFRWVDIEDEAQALGEIDVETFPTLVIGSAAGIAFAGPVLPQAGHLGRMLQKFNF